MVEKILKETYVNPKVELTQSDYNRLVSLAQMKAKKIEERAREFYEKEGVARIRFEGRITRKRYGELETEHFDFECEPAEYSVTPSGEFEKTLFKIPQKQRQRIAQKVGRYVEDVFVAFFGERMYHLNEILKIKAKAERDRRIFIIWTITGWLAALAMMITIIIK